MANKGKNKKKGKGSLSGVAGDNPASEQIVKALTHGGLILLSGLAAGGAGAAIGKHSIWPGLAGILYGAYKDNNPYLIAAGLGFFLSNGYQTMASSQTTTQGVDGLDFKQLATEAKDRVGTFFKNFSEKLYLPTSPPSTTPTTTVQGLGENDVTYFVNPYSKNELDMSALDRIQEQIAAMNKPVSGMIEDAAFEREF